MDGITAYALSKKVAASAVSGVKSMSVDGQTLTINTKDSGVLKMVFPTPSNGVSVTDIDVDDKNQIVFTMSDGTEIISGKIPTVKGDPGDTGKSAYELAKDNGFIGTEAEWLDSLKGLKGDAGVSPTITENADNTDKIYKLDITTADSTFTTPNLKGADGTGGTGGSSTLSSDITSNVEVGGVQSGTNFVEGTNLENIIKKILVKYLPPTATFTITPSNTLKLFGDTITSETMKVVATKKSNDITEIAFKADSTVLNSITSGVNNGGTFSYTYTPSTPISNTVTLSVDVKDGEQTVTKSIKITFCYPTYYGTVADSVASMTASDIQGLDKRVAVNNKAMTWSGISMDYGKLCYSYPKSFGALTSIKDANNVDYINSYTRTEVTLTENGNSVVYYCYLLTDAAGVSNFKQIYA